MTFKNTNAAGKTGGAVILLWQADKSNYIDLAKREQRFFRQLQRAIEIHDANPCSRTQANALIAQRRWMAAYDQLRLANMGGRA